MTKVSRQKLSLRFLGVAALVPVFLPAQSLDVGAWKNQQTLTVEQAGVLKLALPPATLDLARPGLQDLRLVDSAGRETSYLIQHPAPVTPVSTRAPKSFRAHLAGTSTQLLLETGTGDAIDSVYLSTPATGFIKAARIEISADGEAWEVVNPGAPVFRQFGAHQLRLPLEGRRAAWIRITVDDLRSAPIPFTGAAVWIAPKMPPPVALPLDIRVVRRDEFAGESVLTLDLGAAHVQLATLTFVTNEPLFSRRVSLTAREFRDGATVERVLAPTTSIYRVALEGLPPSAQLDVPLDFYALSREVLVHLANGDSPPIAIDGVRAQQYPQWLVFRATEPGTFRLLTGNPRATRPQYDFASLAASLKDTPVTPVSVGQAEPNPAYRRPETLANTPLTGAAIDITPWKFYKTVHVTAAGVQELELDLDVLAGAQPSLADLRLVRDGRQLPFLLERPALSRSVTTTLASADDPKRPQLSRWEIKLPRAGLPLTRLTLTSPTELFRRHLRLFETVVNEGGSAYERTLAEVDWSKTPNDARSLPLNLASAPTTAVITLETDNGDNPPLVIASATATHPVARLLFKTDPGTLALYYGNQMVPAPHYDLGLVADQILAAEKSVATIDRDEVARGESWVAKALAGARGGVVFWGVLAVVVIGLLIVVAKLLPKPPAPAA